MQYSIGEFAAMNRVSTRMLRHYDKIGLLRPDSILSNGYRSYDERQLGTISQIKRLRDCGFLLDEIRSILQIDSPQFLAEEAKRKLAELQGQVIQQQTAIQSLRELSWKNSSAALPSIHGVSLTARGDARILTRRQSVPLDDIESAFDAMFRLLHQKKLKITGCTVLMNYLGNSGTDQNRVGVSISEPYSDERYETLSLASSPVLSVIHYGNYYSIGHAYNALLHYAEQYSYPIDDVFMERYFLDSSYGVIPNEYVTEISVSLKNTP